MPRKRVGIDIDNTLCEGKHWNTPEECLQAVPYPKMIALVNKLYKDNFIIIYTARQNFLMSATFNWLDKHDVKYHAVANGKVPLELLIDDTAVNPCKEEIWSLL
jgi:uncharacterized HAD superfamily protein